MVAMCCLIKNLKTSVNCISSPEFFVNGNQTCPAVLKQPYNKEGLNSDYFYGCYIRFFFLAKQIIIME